MEDLDFSSPSKPAKPAQPAKPARAAVVSEIVYDPNVAIQFFSAVGKPEDFDGGHKFFTEDDKAGGLFSKGDKMYLVVEGAVGLMTRGQFVAVVRPGEVFGELAAVSSLPRTATAVAQSAGKVLSLTEKQFQEALARTPEFALMLMGIMVSRLRKLPAQPASSGKLETQGAVFDKKLLAELQQQMDDRPPLEYPAQKVIVAAGATGTLMYVVMQGSVAIVAGKSIVARVGAGGIFGEMALVGGAARGATAVAESACRLLAINRNEFVELVRAKPAFGAALLKAVVERTSALVAGK